MPLDTCHLTSEGWRNLRTGALTAGAAPFTPKATKPAGLVSVQSRTAIGAMNAYVFKVPWSTVEPTPGSYSWAAIDNELAAYDPWRMTLRIQAGGDAPTWLKTASGGAMECYNAARGITVYTARWWTEVAMSAWQAMIAAAGARYDTDARVSLVSADLPMVVYSEPYILGGHHPTAQALYAAGCTLTTHTDCIRRCVADTCAAFPHTRVELAIHDSLQYPTTSGVAYSWPLGRSLALELCQQYKTQLTISDYGLGVPDTLAAHTPTGTLATETDVYAWMKLRSQAASSAGGGPVGYQLTPNGLTDKAHYMAMAQNAFDLGGWYCETSGWGSLTSDFGTYDTQLKTQAAGGA